MQDCTRLFWASLTNRTNWLRRSASASWQAVSSLVRKPLWEQSAIPKDHTKAFINVGQARGRLGVRELISLQLKSNPGRPVVSAR